MNDKFNIAKPLPLRQDKKLSTFKFKENSRLEDQIKSQVMGIGHIRTPSNYLYNKKILIIGDSFVRIFQSDIPKNVLIIRYSGSPIKSLTRSFPSDITSQNEIGAIGKNANISKKITNSIKSFFEKQ